MKKNKSIQEHHFLDRYLVIVGFVGLSFFFLAHLVFAPLHEKSDVAKLSLSLFGLIVAGLALALIAEFFVKTIALQKEKRIVRYSALVTVNAFFGLVMPLFFARIVLQDIFNNKDGYLALIARSDTLFCEVRWGIINFWSQNSLNNQISNLTFWVLVILVAFFLFGGLWERMRK